MAQIMAIKNTTFQHKNLDDHMNHNELRTREKYIAVFNLRSQCGVCVSVVLLIGKGN